MFSKIIFVLFVCIMLGVGSFLLIYGIKGGLIEKRILVNAWRQEYATGRDAVVRGWFYISIGTVAIVLLFWAVLDKLKR
jgi:hypothetical protein